MFFNKCGCIEGHVAIWLNSEYLDTVRNQSDSEEKIRIQYEFAEYTIVKQSAEWMHHLIGWRELGAH